MWEQLKSKHLLNQRIGSEIWINPGPGVGEHLHPNLCDNRQDRLNDIFLSAQSSLEIREEPQKVTNSRIERLAKLLLKRMSIVEPHGAHKVAPWFSETRKIARAAVAVSNSVGAGVSASDTTTGIKKMKTKTKCAQQIASTGHQFCLQNT